MYGRKYRDEWRMSGDDASVGVLSCDRQVVGSSWYETCSVLCLTYDRCCCACIAHPLLCRALGVFV